jgi:hypothetical protein
LLIVEVMVVVAPFTTSVVTITSHPVQTIVEEGGGDCWTEDGVAVTVTVT